MSGRLLELRTRYTQIVSAGESAFLDSLWQYGLRGLPIKRRTPIKRKTTMALVKFEQKVETILLAGKWFYVPMHVIDGRECLIRSMGRIVHFETEKEALEYFED